MRSPLDQAIAWTSWSRSCARSPPDDPPRSPCQQARPPRCAPVRRAARRATPQPRSSGRRSAPAGRWRPDERVCREVEEGVAGPAVDDRPRPSGPTAMPRRPRGGRRQPAGFGWRCRRTDEPAEVRAGVRHHPSMPSKAVHPSGVMATEATWAGHPRPTRRPGGAQVVDQLAEVPAGLQVGDVGGVGVPPAGRGRPLARGRADAPRAAGGPRARVEIGVRRPDRSKPTAVPSRPAVHTMSPWGRRSGRP